jgi:hypothetical protein
VAREARDLPEVGEQVFDLALKPVDVLGHEGERTPRRYLPDVARIKLLLKAAAAAVAALLYVWYAAVRLAPRARRRRRAKHGR